jgi:hypothetical protein
VLCSGGRKKENYMIAGTLWALAGVAWVAGAFWREKARQHGMAAMHITIGVMSIAVAAMYFAAA